MHSCAHAHAQTHVHRRAYACTTHAGDGGESWPPEQLVQKTQDLLKAQQDLAQMVTWIRINTEVDLQAQDH